MHHCIKIHVHTQVNVASEKRNINRAENIHGHKHSAEQKKAIVEDL